MDKSRDEPRKGEDAPAANPLTRKLNKILNGGDGGRGIGGPSEEVVEALRGLSFFFKSNTKRARVNLRGDLEKKSLAVNEEFLQSFESVHKKLEAVTSDIQGLSTCCAQMTARLQAARADTRALIQRTTALAQEDHVLGVQSDVLRLFLDRFYLRDEEKRALMPSSKDLNEEFFAAFARARQIHEDCRVLLRTNQQRAGLSIMEAMAAVQEHAHERLYRWTQSACRGLSNELPEHVSVLSRALHTLRDRPVLFQYCLTELTTARRSAISRAFIEALTRGGPGGMPKPIELFSHDALRYTSDMLAWLHQAVASEREMLCALLAPPGPDLHSPVRRRFADTRALNEEDRQLVAGALDQIAEATGRPLKVRVEQVLSGEPGLVVCFQLAGVMQFYGTTLARLAGETAALPALIADMRSSTLKMCFDALSVHASGLLAKVEFPQLDLSPPAALDTTLEMLRTVLSSQDASVAPPDIHNAELTKILNCVLDPLLHMCALSSSRLAPTEMATFMLNCFDRIQSCLALFDCAEAKGRDLTAQSAQHLRTLVDEQTRFLTGMCGFTDIFAVLPTWMALGDQRPALSAMPHMDAASIATALARLDECVGGLGHTRACPQCDLLISTRHRQHVLSGGVSSFLQLYRALCAHLAPDTHHPLGRRPPEKIATLLA